MGLDPLDGIQHRGRKGTLLFLSGIQKLFADLEQQKIHGIGTGKRLPVLVTPGEIQQLDKEHRAALLPGKPALFRKQEGIRLSGRKGKWFFGREDLKILLIQGEMDPVVGEGTLAGSGPEVFLSRE